jgi:hypothetical protein
MITRRGASIGSVRAASTTLEGVTLRSLAYSRSTLNARSSSSIISPSANASADFS